MQARRRKMTVTQMERRYQRLAARLAKLQVMVQGTITERTIERSIDISPGEKKVYGPYYQWTFKDKGKTVTVNLAPDQAEKYQRAIDEHRKMEGIVEEMRQLSRKILEMKTVGVRKRKRGGN
jgi:hypothetical protein